jgi:hypothetical protein
MDHLKKRFEEGDNLYEEKLFKVSLMYLNHYTYCKLISLKVLYKSCNNSPRIIMCRLERIYFLAGHFLWV